MKYTHTNIIAKDWKALAAFYEAVFGCKQAGPLRNLSGEWIDGLTGIAGCRIVGAHLALPGYENGPTLEIFSYEPRYGEEGDKAINRYGFGHIAFLVDDVEATLRKLIANGGTALGKVVRNTYPQLGELTAVYARDIEGNIIEIQNWKRP